MSNPTRTYIEYLNNLCPNLDSDIYESIINSLDTTNWDEPQSATDFNNLAVIALVEAENCEDLSLRGLYLEAANEALNNGLDLEQNFLCAAHLSFLMSMMGKMQLALEIALSSWVTALEVLEGNLSERSQLDMAIIYLPAINNNHNQFNQLSWFMSTIFREKSLRNQYLMMLSQSLCHTSPHLYGDLGMRWLEVASKCFPSSLDFSLRLGIYRIIRKEWEGLYYLYVAKKLAANNHRVLHSLYLAYQTLGNQQLAINWLDIAVKLFKENQDSIHWQWVKLGIDSPFTYTQFESDVVLAVQASLSSIVTCVLVAEGDWFEKEMEFWRNWIKPGMTIIDVGANVGVYTFSAAKRVGSMGKVLAIEPFSVCIQCLQETCRVNQFDWVTVCAGAASDRIGTAKLSLCASSELNELVTEQMTSVMESRAFEEVACFTLDSLIEQENLQQVDFLKIDAEGHELAVLTGSQKVLSEFMPIILYENLAGNQGSNLPVADYLVNHGYNLFVYQPYVQLLVPLENLENLQENLNIIALPKSPKPTIK